MIRAARFVVLVCLCAVVLPWAVLEAQPYSFRHVAGYPGGRAYADGQTPQDARFNVARGLSVAQDGLLYVADIYNARVRRMEADGTVSTLFGNGATTTVPGTGSGGSFGLPRVTAVGPDGMLYVANLTEVVKLTPSGTMTLFAGSATAGSADGVGSAARFTGIFGLAVDRFGTVYVADNQLHNIRKIAPDGTVTTFAGLASSSGFADGTGTAARFSSPTGLVVGPDDSLYVADSNNNCIRRITPAGVVTTVAGGTSGFLDGTGTAARFFYPTGITLDPSGNFWIADMQNNAIRKMTPSFAVTTIVGEGGAALGHIDGTRPTARLYYPHSVAAAPNGDVYVAGSDDSIRRVSGNTITTVTGVSNPAATIDGTGAAARFTNPEFVLADSFGNVYVSSGGACIRMVTPAGVVTTVAGSCFAAGLTNANGTSARFRFVHGMRFGPGGNLYIVDTGSTGNNAIRMMTPAGDVTTWASGATLAGARDIVFDPAGNAYVTDVTGHQIRRIDGVTKAITTFAGNGTAGDTDATGTSARFREPWGLAIDGSGSLYVSERQGYRIRRVTTPGAVVTRIAGTNSAGCLDGTGSGARFSILGGIAFGPNGDLYIAEDWNSTIRRLNVSTGVVTTVAGKCDDEGAQDGIGTDATFYSAYSVTFDPSGRLYVADFFNRCIRVGLPLIDDLATIDSPTGGTGLPRQLDTAPQTATSWSWNVVRRPAGSHTTISNPALRNPTVTPDTDDQFVFELTTEGGALGRISRAQVTASCTTPAPPSITSSSPNPSCAGSRVTLEATPGYTSYLWSNGAYGRVITVSPSVQTAYTVRGLIGSCMSDPSAEHTQNVYVPDPATGLTATPTAPNRVTVSWTAPGGPAVHHYNIYRAAKSCGSGMPFAKIGTSATTSFNDDTATPGETYSYTVTAASAGDACESAVSACDDATAYGDCPTDPTFAGLTSVTANNCLLRLTWSPATSNCVNAGTIVYNVYRSTSSSFTPGAANRIAQCVTNTFYDDITAPNGTSYYVVRAEDSSVGNGGACGGGNEETNTVRRSGTLSAAVSTTTHYRDNFDSIRPASAAAYWTETITAPAGNDQLALSACRNVDAGTTYKFGTVGVCTGTYLSSSNQRLELGGDGTVDPAVNGIVLPSTPGTLRLRFRHWYNMEYGWDGASLYYRTTTVTTPTLVGESVSATAPYLVQGLYTANANSSATRAWTGTQSSFAEVIVNLDALKGQTVWLSWRFTSDSIINSEGYYLEDVNIESLTPLACEIAGPPQAFTVTARDGVNKLEWLNPASTYYGTTILRYRTDGVTPTSATDGLPVGTGTKTGTADGYDFFEHTVTNGTAYRYAAFVQTATGLVGPARAAKGRAEPVAETKWIYNTGATAMTPPGIASIYAVSNDRILHSVKQGTAGGDWATSWRPFAMNGPSQARPSVATMTINQIGGAPKVAFVSSQDGYVYAVNAATGAQLWGTQIGTAVQGAPSLALREYGIGLTSVDLIIAGTRNSAPPNGVYALNTQGGAAAWSYTGGGTYTIGVIGGQVSIDYTNRRVYFASRAASQAANQNHTLWCLSFDDTSATRLWSIPLGDIDGSPVVRNNTLYVGTNNGTLYAVDPGTGTVLASYATGDGPIKGYPFPNTDGRVYFSTTNRVWGVADNLTAPRQLTLGWQIGSIPSPSTAVLALGALYAGSSDGRLYKITGIATATPAIASTQLGSGLAAVGTIGYDYTNNLAYVGTAEGAIYAVSIP
ncbi:MAG TPA: PQQ-binding-like beta-propeller repeat protein [Thermoanaerobaculia bacterium]